MIINFLLSLFRCHPQKTKNETESRSERSKHSLNEVALSQLSPDAYTVADHISHDLVLVRSTFKPIYTIPGVARQRVEAQRPIISNHETLGVESAIRIRQSTKLPILRLSGKNEKVIKELEKFYNLICPEWEITVELD